MRYNYFIKFKKLKSKKFVYDIDNILISNNLKSNPKTSIKISKYVSGCLFENKWKVGTKNCNLVS